MSGCRNKYKISFQNSSPWGQNLNFGPNIISAVQMICTPIPPPIWKESFQEKFHQNYNSTWNTIAPTLVLVAQWFYPLTLTRGWTNSASSGIAKQLRWYYWGLPTVEGLKVNWLRTFFLLIWHIMNCWSPTNQWPFDRSLSNQNVQQHCLGFLLYPLCPERPS